MSIQSIFDYIDKKNYISNNEISFNNYFRGDMKDYNDNENIIELFKKNIKINFYFQLIIQLL